ncbi:DUF4232 domain-containing protein [Amycolatopsis samaneae]|uniref:DUF4232 domain-containing protein n=1 Tax=Amycolatopsis samaneae TaxID=664691 RepID=A0ABW5G7T4_9PSEU
MTRSSTRRGIAVLAIAGATTAGVALLGTAARATPHDLDGCAASQLDAALIAGSPGAGQRYAAVQFTARPGQTCDLEGVLPVTARGASGLTVEADPAGSARVTLTPGGSAHLVLHWTSIEAPAEQVTPCGITVAVPGSSGESVDLPWRQGPVDSSAPAHRLTVGAVRPGPAPRA